MSSEPSSNTPTVPTSGSSKRTRRAERSGRAPSETSSTAPTQPPVLQTPLVAALTMGTSHVETLHREAQPFLKELLGTLLGQFATYYWKHKKHQEMVSDNDYVPSSCKHGLTLNALQEVRESEDYITLCIQLEVEIAQSQRNLATYALRVYDMNRLAHRRRYKNGLCKLLPTAARIFLAQFGVEAYGVHQVVMDLLAMHSDEILSPLNNTLTDFLLIYREVNELAILPSPTVLNDIYDVIDAVNGPRPGEEPPAPPAAAAAASSPATAATTQNTAPAAPNLVENQLTIQSDAHEYQAQSSPATIVAAAAAETASQDATSLAIVAAIATNLATAASSLSTPQSAVRNPYLREQTFIPPVPRFTLPVLNQPDVPNAPSTGGVRFEDGTGDEVMEDDTTAPVVIGGRGVIIKALRDLVVKGIFNPIEAFDKQVKMQEEAKRVKKATLRPQLSCSADRIAAIVNAERPATPATLRGLVREEATNNTSRMESEIQSLKAQMEALLSGKKKKKPPPSTAQHQKKGNHTSSNASAKNGKGVGKNGKAATKKKKSANPPKAKGGKPASTAANKNKRPNPSRSKSNGKKPAGNKKKRS